MTHGTATGNYLKTKSVKATVSPMYDEIGSRHTAMWRWCGDKKSGALKKKFENNWTCQCPFVKITSMDIK